MDDYNSTTPVPPRGNNVPAETEDGEAVPPAEIEVDPMLLDVDDEDGKKDDDDEQAKWDGTEAEYVADDDALAYEEPLTGIKLTYVLRHAEVFSCLKHMGFCKTTGRRAVIETVLLAVVCALFIASYFIYGGANNLVLGIFCAVLIAVVWVVPRLGINARARELTTGKSVYVEIFPDAVEVGKGKNEWAIPLDSTSEYEEFDNMMVLFTPDGKLFTIPMRAVEPSVLPDVQAMLMAGTMPRGEE